VSPAAISRPSLTPDTLIVWTEPGTSLDIALSFQDCEGCEDIWQFIAEVQRHLNNLPGQSPSPCMPRSAHGSRHASAVIVVAPFCISNVGRRVCADGWSRHADDVGAANIVEHQVGRSHSRGCELELTGRQQEMWLRMQAKSAQGRERAVEHIIGEVSCLCLEYVELR